MANSAGPFRHLTDHATIGVERFHFEQGDLLRGTTWAIAVPNTTQLAGVSQIGVPQRILAKRGS